MRFQIVFNPILLSSKAKALRRRRVHLCDPYLSTVSWRIQDRLCIFSLCFSFLFPPSYLTTYTYLLCTTCWVQRHSPLCQGQSFQYLSQLLLFPGYISLVSVASYKVSYETSFALVLYDFSLSETKLTQTILFH